jgi:hypothetical protein
MFPYPKRAEGESGRFGTELGSIPSIAVTWLGVRREDRYG